METSTSNVVSITDKLQADKEKSLPADTKVSSKFQIQRLALPEVLLIRPKNVFSDNRGVFTETYRHGDLMKGAGIGLMPVQGSLSHSGAYVMRGLHYQMKDPQGKFITVISGKIFDVAVDLRRGSLNFGKWCGAVLDSNNPGSMYIPPKFAHGFMTFERGASVFYLCTTYHDASSDRTLRWNDPALGIQWPIGHGANVSMSARDRTASLFAEAETFE